MQNKRIGKKESIVSGIKNFRCQNKRAIIKNGISDDGLIVCLAPCFKSGGFDIYSIQPASQKLLDDSKGEIVFSIPKPILPVRDRKPSRP
jgi:hypothetical protein